MTSRLKSVITSRNHRRHPSEIKNLSPTRNENMDPRKPAVPFKDIFLPSDNPHAQQKLRDSPKTSDNVRPSPKKSIEVYEDDNRTYGLHKKSKSSVSLKSLMGNDKDKKLKTSSPEKMENKKPKKSKSSTSLSALLSRPKSSKGPKTDDSHEPKDKENQTPPTTENIAPPPIWALFASERDESFGGPTKIPLNDTDGLTDEMALYTPQDYSPSKQRNFGDYERPTLSRGIDRRPRPKSAVLPSAPSNRSFTETLSRLRQRSGDKGQKRLPSDDLQAQSRKQESRRSSDERNIAGSRIDAEQVKSEDLSEQDRTRAKGGSRVMAAVAAFNDRSQEPAKQSGPVSKSPEPPLDPAAINNAFEELLVRYRSVCETMAKCTNRTQGTYPRMCEIR
jgi:hypothetical protein